MLNIPAGLAGAPDPLQSAVQAQSQEIPAVKNTVTDALILNGQIGLPVPRQTSTLKPVPADIADTTITQIPPAPTPAELDQVRAYDTQRLNTVFGHDPSALKEELYGLTNAIDEQRDPNYRFIDAGVSRIDFATVSVTGDTAKSLATTYEWSSEARGTRRATQYNQPFIMHWTVDLEKIDGTWAITNRVGVPDAKSMP